MMHCRGLLCACEGNLLGHTWQRAVCLCLQVKDFEAFRRALPAEAKMYVAKNTLMRLASERVDGWGTLAQVTHCQE